MNAYACGIFTIGGNVNINGGEVEATGSIENREEGIIVLKSGSNGGSISISNATVTASGSIGIHANSGITINSGTVTTNNCNYGIFASSCSLTINGGQVTANGSTYGIWSEGDLTLGWTNASDYIHANSYLAGGILSIAEGKAFITEDGIAFESGTVDASDINGKTLYPYIEGSVPYIDENGQLQLCIEYNVLNGTETTLGTSGQETWYVADGTLDYSQTITLSGNVHLILKDNTVMNVGTEETPVNGHGIYGNGHSISIYAQSMGESQGQLHLNVNADDPYQYCGIIALYSSITINGGKVSATGYSGIFGVHAPININGGQVTVDGSGWGIYGGDNNININGGQVTANGGRYGIQADGGNITLGWTNVTDFIYANSYENSYSTDITLSKAFIDEAGQTYSGTIARVSGAYAINGKKLTAYIEGSVPYLDMNGERQLCTEYTTLTGNESSLAAGWYVVDGTPSYNHTVLFSGAVNIIVKDGAQMSITTQGGSNNQTDWFGLSTSNGSTLGSGSLGIFGQSTGSSQGKLVVNTKVGTGIRASILNISSVGITATAENAPAIYADGDITLKDAAVTATSESTYNDAIKANGGNISIDGGAVTATAGEYRNSLFAVNGSITMKDATITANKDVYAENGNVEVVSGQVTANYMSVHGSDKHIILGWTNADDFITVSGFSFGNAGCTVKIKDGLKMTDGTEIYEGTITAFGKTLIGVDVLEDATENDVAALDGKETNIILHGRKLYKDGDWNTLCLPFSVTDFKGTPLEGATVMELDTENSYNGHKTGLDGTTLYLNFLTAESIEAGKPYLVKWWPATEPNYVENPVFQGVTVDAANHDVTSNDNKVSFRGTYAPLAYSSEDYSVLFLGTNNRLYFPKSGAKINRFRAYFQLDEGANVREFKLSFGDNNATGVVDVRGKMEDGRSDAWYNLDGRRLDGKPAKKGLYIVNGRKVVIK